jgi:hypothetical protein
MSYIIVTIDRYSSSVLPSGIVEATGLDVIGPHALCPGQEAWLDDCVDPLRPGDYVLRGMVGVRKIKAPAP